MRDSLMVLGAIMAAILIVVSIVLGLLSKASKPEEISKTCTKIDRIEEHSAGMYTYEIYARTEGVENY